jgi:hypothetical protein
MQSLQRDTICKVNADRTNQVLLLYVKFTNIQPLQDTDDEDDDVTINMTDTVGYFTTQAIARNVAECINRLIPVHHVFDGKYKLVLPYVSFRPAHSKRLWCVVGMYKPVGYFAPHKFTNEIVLSVAETKEKLNYETLDHLPNNNNNLHVDGPYIKRYVVNDIMPTMSMDDYDLSKHRSRLKTVLSHLMDVPWSKKSRQELRREARASGGLISHIDSSDSENSDNYKPISQRSLFPMLTKSVTKTRRRSPSPPPLRRSSRTKKPRLN